MRATLALFLAATALALLAAAPALAAPTVDGSDAILNVADEGAMFLEVSIIFSHAADAIMDAATVTGASIQFMPAFPATIERTGFFVAPDSLSTEVTFAVFPDDGEFTDLEGVYDIQTVPETAKDVNGANVETNSQIAQAIIDFDRPTVSYTVTVASGAATGRTLVDGDIASIETATYTLDFSEELSTPLALGGLSIDGGASLSGFSAVSNQQYTVTADVSGVADGAYVLTVAMSAVADVAGNENQQSTFTFTTDRVAPTAQLTGTAPLVLFADRTDSDVEFTVQIQDSGTIRSGLDVSTITASSVQFVPALADVTVSVNLQGALDTDEIVDAVFTVTPDNGDFTTVVAGVYEIRTASLAADSATDMAGNSAATDAVLGQLTIEGGAVTGDPHIEGFLGQHFIVDGAETADNQVYNMITSPWMQYNARFSATKFKHKAGGHHVPATQTTEIGFSFAGGKHVRLSLPEHSQSLLMNVVVEVDGEQLPTDQRIEPIDVAPGVTLSSTHRNSHEIRIVTPRFFITVDARKHMLPHLDCDVKLVDWSAADELHGILGQTARADTEQTAIDKARGETLADVFWPWYLDGLLQDYHVEGNDVFGTGFVFNRF